MNKLILAGLGHGTGFLSAGGNVAVRSALMSQM